MQHRRMLWAVAGGHVLDRWCSGGAAEEKRKYGWVSEFSARHFREIDVREVAMCQNLNGFGAAGRPADSARFGCPSSAGPPLLQSPRCFSRHFRSALAIFESTLDPDHPHIALCRARLAESDPRFGSGTRI